MIKLNKSSVVFNEEHHTYHLGDKQLKGVTGILERRLFADKYKNVPANILQKAAKRGSHIHKMCELVDTLNVVPNECQEAMNYIALKKRLGLKAIASEYLVSDNQHYASSIDVIYDNGEGVIINDRKTTSTLDKEYLSWQLSIYAMFFEMLNPEIKVDGLSATWLRGDICEYVTIERKPEDLVKALLLADINDEPFDYEVDKGIPDFIEERLSTMVFINERIKALNEQLNVLKKEVEDTMKEKDIKSVKTPYATFSYTLPKVTTSFDTKLFKEENQELYQKYIKEQNKQGYLTIKFK